MAGKAAAQIKAHRNSAVPSILCMYLVQHRLVALVSGVCGSIHRNLTQSARGGAARWLLMRSGDSSDHLARSKTEQEVGAACAVAFTRSVPRTT